MSPTDSKITTIQTHFKALSTAAKSLNAASDELTKAVGVLDEALKKLNVGLTVWVTFRSRAVEDWEYDDDEIGYAKIQSKWGIALRRTWGDNRSDNYGGEGPWLFNDAPREMRLYGVDKLPQVIEALDKEASATTKKIQQKTQEVRELGGVIEKIASEPKGYRTPKKADTVVTVGLSPDQFMAILSGVEHQQKFVGELLHGATRWERWNSELRIYFPSDKQAFAEMLRGLEPLSKVNAVANEVLGFSVQVVVRLEPSVAADSKATINKGGK